MQRLRVVRAVLREGAIQIIDARLGGRGQPLRRPRAAWGLPQDAITIEERDADVFDEMAVQSTSGRAAATLRLPCQLRWLPVGAGAQLRPPPAAVVPRCGRCRSSARSRRTGDFRSAAVAPRPVAIQLHWCADCSFLRGADVLLARLRAVRLCRLPRGTAEREGAADRLPKLDNTAPYLDKLVAMIEQNQIKSLTVCTWKCRAAAA